MKMKKILAMLLAVAMVMALAACGGKNASAPSGGNNAGQSGEATPPADDGGKDDVTANYDVKFINGTLTINARKITVSLNPVDSITYGDELPVPEYTTAGYGDLTEGLVNGDELIPTYVYKKAADDTVPEHYDAGNYKIYLDGYEFVYANGAPATIQNYEVIGEISPVDFDITKRKITITLKDFSREYGRNCSSLLLWEADCHHIGCLCDMALSDLIRFSGNGLAVDDKISSRHG